MNTWYRLKKTITFLGITSLYACASDQNLTSTQITSERKNVNSINILIETPQTASIKQEISKTISLQDAAALVIAYHPRIAQARSNEKGEEEMINVAKSNYYPQIKGGTRVEYNDRPEGNQRHQNKILELEVRQTLYDFGKTANTVKGAEYDYEGAKVNTAATNESFIHAATSTVIESVRQAKLIVLAKQQVNQVNSFVSLVEERHDKGASNLSDLLHAKSRLNDVQSESLDAQTQYQVQLQNLRYLTGVSTIDKVNIDNPPKALEQACSLPIDWESIPEYIIADLESKKALADLELSKSEEKPTIYVMGTASHSLDQNNSPRYNSRSDSKISLNISAPIYQGGGLSAQKRASENWAHAAAARKETVKLDIGKTMDDARIKLQNMKNRQSLLTQRVNNLQGTRELYKRQYLDLGSRSLVDLLNSEQEFHKAQVDVVNNRLDIIQTQLDCAYYHGKLEAYFDVK